MYFEVHQPMRLKKFSIFSDDSYFDNEKNTGIFNRVADKCYLPANRLLLQLLDEHPDFKISFSLTGIFLEQCSNFPDVLDSFKELSKKKNVEFLSETYYHSLSALFHDKKEFLEQIKEHENIMKEIGIKISKVFRNTEALYSNEISELIENIGYEGIITEGWDPILGWRSPNHIYKRPEGNIKILLRNYKMSDDLSYRFSAKWWPEWPLTADRYSKWLSLCEGDCVNLFMDYETFGEHQWEDTGIFSFLRHFPNETFHYDNLNFKLPSELIQTYKAVGDYDVVWPISWADMERDTSAWLGNEMQKACFKELQSLGELIKSKNNETLLKEWKLMTSSDHFHYMCTKSWADGDVHKYFSCFDTPYDAFIAYMNILQNMKYKISKNK